MFRIAQRVLLASCRVARVCRTIWRRFNSQNDTLYLPKKSLECGVFSLFVSVQHSLRVAKFLIGIGRIPSRDTHHNTCDECDTAIRRTNLSVDLLSGERQSVQREDNSEPNNSSSARKTTTCLFYSIRVRRAPCLVCMQFLLFTSWEVIALTPTTSKVQNLSDVKKANCAACARAKLENPFEWKFFRLMYLLLPFRKLQFD